LRSGRTVVATTKSRTAHFARRSLAIYLEENMHLASIEDSALHLRQLDPFIGALTLDRVHSGTLQPFTEQRRRAGVKMKSINNALGLVRRILNLSARLWRDEHGLTWLENAPLIQLLPDSTAREPYPLDWEEQRRLFQALPDHLGAGIAGVDRRGERVCHSDFGKTSAVTLLKKKAVDGKGR